VSSEVKKGHEKKEKVRFGCCAMVRKIEQKMIVVYQRVVYFTSPSSRRQK